MDTSKILITGASGQLGLALRQQYPDAKSADSEQLDIANRRAVENFDWSDITTVINAAAYTDVDGAESADGRIAAWQVNAMGPANLARIAIEKDMVLVHISTEYVFDGSHDPHTEDEPFSPLSTYGASKAAGDTVVGLIPKHYLVRTSWVVGDGKNFVRTMLALGKKGVNPAVVDDQVGRLTFTDELARGIDHLISSQPPYGTYNITGGGQPASWAEVAEEIFEQAGFSASVSKTTTGEYFSDKPEAAKRPLNSVLDLSKIQACGFEPKGWRAGLESYLKKETENSK